MRAATIRDVAHAADVSVATVSRTLNGLDTVAGATRDRILKVAGELDYVPHSGARALSTKRTDTIGVLLPDLHGEFFSELIRGIDLAARARGLHLLLSSFHGDPAEAAAALRAMRSRVDSIIVMSPQAGDGRVPSEGANGVPTVFLGGNGQRGSDTTLVIDNFEGAFELVQHLLDVGHRSIAFIAGPADNIEATERLRGYRAALASSVGGSSEWIVQGDFGEESGSRAAYEFVARGLPDAIFCANDMMAIGCLDGLRSAGFNVPEDVALAGFDDIPITRYVNPPLTTAAVPIAQMGQRALECCAEALAGAQANRRHIFKPELVIRASSGSTKKAAANHLRTRGDLQ